MTDEVIASALYQELQKIRDTPEEGPFEQVKAYYGLLQSLFLEATQQERMRFSTLFSRIAYVAQKHGFHRHLLFYLHTFRKQSKDMLRSGRLHDDKAYLPELGHRVLLECLQQLFQLPLAPEEQSLLASPWPFPLKPAEITAFKSFARVVALADHPSLKQFLIVDELEPDEERRMQYDLPESNEAFNPTISLIKQVCGFPVVLQLLDVEIDQHGVYRPRALVLNPDYLIDVTAIAECFRDAITLPESYLLRKFLDKSNHISLLQGQIANLFLDELIHHPESDFAPVFAKTFQINPLQFAGMEDGPLKELVARSRLHFENLKKAIQEDLPAEGIERTACCLEPSFYAREYGIQGRLDLLCQTGKKTAIVELKSSKLYKPNQYGLNANNYVQTLLYDLLIRAAFGRQTDPRNYILYSSQAARALRYAPVVKSQQHEAMAVRNQLLGYEYRLASMGSNTVLGKGDLLEQGERLLRIIQSRQSEDRFFGEDCRHFLSVIGSADETEKRYFFAFCGFIAREQQLAKTGIEGIENANGQAALWRNSIEEKEADFDILANLSIRENHAASLRPQLLFDRTEHTSPMANFREGDIAILYPYSDASPLSNQLLKCTIIELSAETVRVELRARQTNPALFESNASWCLEHDLMDNSYANMYRSLFEFLSAVPAQKQWLLGRSAPSQEEAPNAVESPPQEMTPEQQAIFQKMLRSRDYFLLWGPPGTGKTSVMLKHMAGHWLAHESGNLLILAFTNRAVDEICAAIESNGPDACEQYLRIGARYSTAPAFQNRLLSVQSERHPQTRKSLLELIQKHRIVVGTVASISGKPELFKLKTFDRAVIDEASQIPEPMLMGMLTRFAHVTLIGDHKQLPAVVAQSEAWSAVEDPALNALGVHNLRNSLFERLYRRCQLMGWDHAYACLSHQGRMHQDIMEFPNRFFYEGRLQTLPEGNAGFLVQVARELFPASICTTEFEAALAQNRMIFVPVPSEPGPGTKKTHAGEAQAAAQICIRLHALYGRCGKAWQSGSLGIITPYRAQIAQIRHALQSAGFEGLYPTIDTVERYQGGARDAIVLSLCAHSERQLRSIGSFSEEGIDRKLNVALTRARELLIILGDPTVLSKVELYRSLIANCLWINNL